ncbi:RIP metalloprotease RseP [Romboutsia weinsteinii]|uniref:Zinc metalloprotease n=1 Tax=Romboutsia weinsteinii TaxID=2020949 RepID=A0A371IXH7_9FIRM|nr:RIP metalloprotease RseP [Romboutsia weinsteinii]RDY25187.1 RIP metalloprotease RseP [Romboutsia weinsteinii]
MTILVAILLFGAIVFIHELGHFLLAKKNGVTIHEFSIGMGPKIFSIKRDVEYSIRLLPLGGFVSMEGEDGESKDKNAFGKKSIIQRASILFAGPFFNIVFAVILFIPVFMYIGTPGTTLSQIVPNSPAQVAGLQEGDKIESVSGEKVNSWQDVVTNLTNSEGKEVKLVIDRDGKDQELNIVPEKNEEGRYVIGIAPKYEKSITKAIATAFTTTGDMIVQMVKFVGQLITGTVPGGVSNSVTGPIGVISLVSDAAKTGIINVVYIGAIISLNLGILNLLPIPALDGGRLLMILIEALRGGKKIDPNKEATLHIIGFGALMLFMLFVTYKDILRLF